VSAKKLVVATYLQYVLIALGALLLFAFVRQLGGVFLTFLLAAILAYVLNALFLVAQQQLEGNVLQPRIMGGSVGVHSVWVLFATLAATALYCVDVAAFAVPIVAIIAAAPRYLREILIFERWRKAPVTEIVFDEGQPEAVATGGEPASLRGSAERKQ
jgi:predicted PurR-regulated permease PerM